MSRTAPRSKRRPAASSPSAKDPLLALSSWKQHALALAVLFALPLILFSKTTIGGMDLNRHDIVQWRAGAESVLQHAEQFGERPLWAANMFVGMPSYIAIKPQTLPHLDSIQTLFKPIYPAWQFWVLLGGMYLFLTLMGLRSVPALFGSVLFGLTTYITIIIYAGHNSKLLALIYVPWVLAGYWTLMRRQEWVYGAALFTAALSLELRAGHPQITYYLLCLMLMLWGRDTWIRLKGAQAREWGTATALLAFGTVLAVMAYAQGFLPIQEYSAYSTRGGSAIFGGDGLGRDYSFAWSQGLLETFTLLVPDLLGGASPEYWGAKSVTSGPHYLGALALPFVFLGLFISRRADAWIFAGAGALGIMFAWGENFMLLNGPAFDWIPLFDKFRAPETWLVLTILGLSVVAAMGMDALIGRMREEQGDRFKGLWAPLGLSLGLAAGMVALTQSLSYEKPGETEQIAQQLARQNQLPDVTAQARQAARNYVRTQLVPAREDRATGDASRMALLVVLATGAVALTAARKVPAGPAMALLVAVSAYDLISVNHRYIPNEAFVQGGQNEEAIILSSQREIDRFVAEGVRIPDQAWPYRALPLLDGPFSNALPSYFYPSLGGYSGAKLSLAQDVLLESRGPLFTGPDGINSDLLSLLNVKYLTYADGLTLPGWRVAERTADGTVYENLEVMPKAFFVDSVHVVASPAEAFEKLFPGAMPLRSAAVVELVDGVSEAPSTSPDPGASVEITEYRADRIRLVTERSTPGFLVLSEVYYPAGWTAAIGEKTVPIYKTDYLLRGVQVPPGRQRIELRFEPESFRIGTLLGWISTGAQALMLALCGVVFILRRKET